MADKDTSLNLDDSRSKFEQGWIEYRKGEHAKARDLLLMAIEEHPDRPDEARYLLGKIELEQGNASRAIAYLQLASDGNSPTYDALIELGNAYEDAGRLPEAKKTWERAIARDQRRHEAYVCLGTANYNCEEFQLALNIVTRGLDKVDSLAGVLLLRKAAAFCEIKLKHFAEAQDHLNFLINRCPDYGVFYYYRSQCWLEVGEREKCLRDAAEAVKLEPEDDEFLAFFERLKLGSH